MKQSYKIGISTLLKRNISKWQLTGFSIANLLGLTVILSGILFYCDSRHHISSSDKFFSDDYIVVSKKVKGINLEPTTFTEDEVMELSSQPWVKKLGRFTSADFSVNASINMGGRGMSSYLFFESVPDDFFDTMPSGWSFNPDKRFVPIVLNRDYLALYNFGFAVPQGLPQLSEEMISTVPLKLMINGSNGKAEFFDAAVVGFSSRLNTIAVPQEFMDWANTKFSSETEQPTSRLILKIDLLNSGDYEKYLAEHGLEIAGDKEGTSKVSEFLGVVSGVIEAVGIVIAFLAIFILVLSIALLLQKSRTMISYLFLLGFSPWQLAKYYNTLVITLNLIITLLGVGLTFVCRLIWHKHLEALGLGDGNVLFMLGSALLYLLIITSVNIIVIRKHLYKIWNIN